MGKLKIIRQHKKPLPDRGCREPGSSSRKPSTSHQHKISNSLKPLPHEGCSTTSGDMLKDATPGQLPAGIRIIAQGEPLLSPQ
jgi:hypothetical protein